MAPQVPHRQGCAPGPRSPLCFTPGVCFCALPIMRACVRCWQSNCAYRAKGLAQPAWLHIHALACLPMRTIAFDVLQQPISVCMPQASIAGQFPPYAAACCCQCCSHNAWSLESLALTRPSGAAAPAVDPTQLAAACSLPPGRHVLPEVRTLVDGSLWGT